MKVVFLRGVNVGGHKTFRPSQVAKQLAKYGVINVGAAGTFVVDRPITEAKLRKELRRCFSFDTEMMICPANDILRLAAEDTFAGEADGPDIVRFVSVLAKGPRVLPPLPRNLPTSEDWLVRIIAVRGRFALGLYRRAMRTISLLGQIEKRLGGSITTRNWNTLTKIIQVLKT
jgi:uncharacterized protein (DUF1697 family)